MNRSAVRSIILLLACGLISFGLITATASLSIKFMAYPAVLLCVFVSFIIQWIAFVPSYRKQTEKFFDLIGSFTFLLVTSLALFLTGTPSLYQFLLGFMVMIWAVRLGSFLFIRIHEDGSDERFEGIKSDKYRFFSVWTIQGLWVSVTSIAAVTAITSVNQPKIGWLSLIGASIWLLGLIIEVVADRQKRNFKQQINPTNSFITTGLWSVSRHPNYLGEIILWIGVAIVAVPALSGWQYIVLCSPLFVILLLVKISGIPLLESKADNKWGGDENYINYKESTSVLIPKVW